MLPISCDDCMEFAIAEMDALCKEYLILRTFSRPRHSQSNGQVERKNQTICRLLQNKSHLKKIKAWLDVLFNICEYYNYTIHKVERETLLALNLKCSGVFKTILFPK